MRWGSSMYSSSVMRPKIAYHYPDCNSVSLRHTQKRLCDDLRMELKPVAEVRRGKFVAAVDEVGGVVLFARLHNQNPDWIRQMYNGKGRKGGINIGAEAARKIEGWLKKPPNWLDHEGEVPAAIHSENDVIALQIAIRSLVKALAVATPLAAPVFAAQVQALAEAQGFSTRQALLANLLAIAEQGQHTAEVVAQPLRQRASGASTRR